MFVLLSPQKSLILSPSFFISTHELASVKLAWSIYRMATIEKIRSQLKNTIISLYTCFNLCHSAHLFCIQKDNKAFLLKLARCAKVWKWTELQMLCKLFHIPDVPNLAPIWTNNKNKKTEIPEEIVGHKIGCTQVRNSLLSWGTKASSFTSICSSSRVMLTQTAKIEDLVLNTKHHCILFKLDFHPSQQRRH